MKMTMALENKMYYHARQMKRNGESGRYVHHYTKDYRIIRVDHDKFRVYIYNPDGLIDDLIGIIDLRAAK